MFYLSENFGNLLHVTDDSFRFHCKCFVPCGFIKWTKTFIHCHATQSVSLSESSVSLWHNHQRTICLREKLRPVHQIFSHTQHLEIILIISDKQTWYRLDIMIILAASLLLGISEWYTDGKFWVIEKMCSIKKNYKQKPSKLAKDATRELIYVLLQIFGF